jgi:uncharacterized integral membrane protein
VGKEKENHKARKEVIKKKIHGHGYQYSRVSKVSSFILLVVVVVVLLLLLLLLLLVVIVVHECFGSYFQRVWSSISNIWLQST